MDEQARRTRVGHSNIGKTERVGQKAKGRKAAPKVNSRRDHATIAKKWDTTVGSAHNPGRHKGGG